MANQFEDYTILDSLVDAALVIGAKGEIYYSNEAVSKLCDIPFRQISKKKNLKELFTITPSSLLDPSSLEALLDQTPYEEVSFTSSSGKTGRVQISLQPVLNGAGAKQILLFIHDVTLEERLQAKYRSELSQKDSKISEITLLLEISNALTGISDTATVYKNVATQLVTHGICDYICHLQYQEDSDDLQCPMMIYNSRDDSKMLEFSKDVLTPFKNLWSANSFLDLTQKTHEKLFKLLAAKIKVDGQTFIRLIPIQTAKFRKGVFLLVSTAPKEEKQENLELMKSIIAQMGVALESALFFENSITDEMTKLYNKRYMMARLLTEIERARRNNEALSFVIFDVDHFKQFNDKYGHQTGDLVLKEVAQVTKNFCRVYDVAARYGGEEFVLILPKTYIEGSEGMAERLRKKIEDLTVTSNGIDLKVTVSLGVAEFPSQSADVDDLISIADKALYFAKRAGRNQVKVYGADCETKLAVAKI